MMRNEGTGVWAASSRARVRPVGPAPIMRMSISGLDIFVMRFVRMWGGGERKGG